MSYYVWFTSHRDKHHKIIQKLLERGFDKEAIIDYFDFNAMLEHEPDFCPLYAQKRQCHDMAQLNCYLCACPNFRFDDNGIDTVEGATRYSFCAIDSVKGAQVRYDNAIHQDCSKCSVPHDRAYIEKHFDLAWEQIMKRCSLDA